jgi:hypothetical protein
LIAKEKNYMGFHICEYCQRQNAPHPATSSGDVVLEFENGHKYIMPDMITHYIREHGYQPPDEFQQDVISGKYAGGERLQSKSIPESVGYLSGPFLPGKVPPLFVYILAGMMAFAREDGQRRQTRGL